MSNKNSEQFAKGMQNMHLSPEEKSEIRHNVLNFISLYPIGSKTSPGTSADMPSASRTSNGTSPVRTGIAVRPNIWSNLFLKNLNFTSTMAVLLILAVLVGGGVSVAAEKALPGDILYPVKVDINEKVRGWLSVSEESKANWEVKRAERRLEEAETLAGEGSLDVEAREKIEANFEAHSDRVKKRIEKFESKENFNAAVDVSAKFETSLKAHNKILGRLTAETSETRDEVKKEVRPIHVRVQSEVKAWAKTRKSMELRAGGSANAELNSGEDDSGDEEELELENETETDLELNLDNGTIKGEGRLRARLGL